MFNLDNYKNIIFYLEKFTKLPFKKTSKEYIFFCPFCDDCNKKTHGHLYLAIDKPVFYCFRCNVSGNLKKLLQYIDYDNIPSELEDFYEPKTLDYSNNVTINNFNFIDNIRTEIYNFQNKYKKEYIIFENYLNQRLGHINFLKFLIVPSFFKNNLVIKFYNYDGQLVTMRNILIDNVRYYKPKDLTGIKYYFQSQEFKIPSTITIAEGCFDIINLYLYNIFQDSLFYAILGNHYVKSVENLIINRLLIGKHNINIIFDNDVLNYNEIQKILKRMPLIYNNPGLNFNFFKPSVGKDVSECIELIKTE